MTEKQDIVARLRENAVYWTGTTGGNDLLNEAADEIDHLRNEVEALREEIWHRRKYPDDDD